MMGMHKLLTGDGYTYLTRQVAAGDAGLSAAEPLVVYYQATGTPPGRLCGSGLAGLGGEQGQVRTGDVVTEAGMAAVFRDGCDLITGHPLGHAYADRRARPVVGFDLTFTIPKSASVLWALGEEPTRRAVVAAHHAAVAQALAFVDDQVVRTRVGAGGRRQIRTLGMVAAAFDHYDSRAGDPNVHTHVVLANKVQGPDKRWRSLDGKTIHAATVTVSELYDGLVADELHRRLHVAWSARHRGVDRNEAFEIDGIDDGLLRAFSSRSERIHEVELDWAEEFRATRGRGPSRLETIRARQHLTRVTRPAKVVRPLTELLTEWGNRARALTGVEPQDLTARALAGDYSRGLQAHDVGPVTRAALIAQVLDDVSGRRSVWSTWNLGAAAARVAMPLRMASPRQRLRLLHELTTAAADRCVQLDDTRDPATRRIGEAQFTSVELLGAERVLLDAAEATDFPLALRGWEARTLPDAPELADLSSDQSTAVQAALTSPHRLDVLVGPAGSGKTTTLAALTAVTLRHGRPVVGLAPSASAAHTLREALGIRTETTAKWLYEACGAGAAARSLTYDRAQEVLLTPGAPRSEITAANERMWRARSDQDTWRFSRGQVVIVDEASLADTRTLATLVQLAEQADAKVLLVGDHLQRGAVGAGGAFGMLARRGPTAELTALHRFVHPWEARASLDLRHGQPDSLDAYAAHGAISAGDLDLVIDQALDAGDAAASAGRVALLQAADLRTVRELNARARQRAVVRGEAGADGVGLHDGLVAGVGDRVVTRYNDRRLRAGDGYVRNGALWDVAAIDPDGAMRVRPALPTPPRGGTGRWRKGIQQPGDGTVRLPAEYVAAHVELGYAVTTARSQGLTVDESHTIATPGMAREDLYVALTRGRQANRLYVATDVVDDDCPPGIAGTDGRQTARQVLDQILATSHAELSATETWAAFHPLEDAPVPPPARLDALSPRYVERLEARGAIGRARAFRAPPHPAPVSPPPPVIERVGP